MDRLSERTQGLIIAVIIIVVVGAGLSLLLAGRYTSIPCGGPCPGNEALNLETRSVNTPTNMTLNILNTGSLWVSLVSYSARPSSSQTYSNSTVAGLSFGPNTLLAVNIVIDGGRFTFQPGTSYTIMLLTSRNNQFYFTVDA